MKHDVDYLKDESYRLIGAGFEVYNDRGFGLAEEIYQECLEIELGLRGITFRAKQELTCSYKGRELKKRYIPDLFVFGGIVVELKAVSQLLPEHEAQLLNYLLWVISSISAKQEGWTSSASSSPNSFLK